MLFRGFLGFLLVDLVRVEAGNQGTEVPVLGFVV